MSIKATLQQDMKQAMRSGEKLELSAVRMVLAAIKKKEIDDQTELDDAAVTGVLEKLIKQGKDSAGQYAQAGREELAAKETAEIAILERYLPKSLSEAEVETLIADAIAATGADGVRDMGKVMAEIKAKATGRIDMGRVSGRVRELLSAG